MIRGQFCLVAVLHLCVPLAALTLVDLPWSDDLVVLVLDKLVPVGEPSLESWQCEENGEVLGRESNCFVDDSRVEVDIWVQLAVNEVLV